MRAQWTKEHGHEHAQKSMLLIKGLDELIAVAALTSEDELRRATSSGPKRLRTQRALILLGLRGQSYSLIKFVVPRINRDHTCSEHDATNTGFIRRHRLGVDQSA